MLWKMPFLRSILAVALLSVAASAETIRVGVAVSLREAMEDIATAYHGKTGDTIECTFGSSGQIAAQIENGADIDVFLSAANKQVDDLAKDGLVVRGSRRVIAGNAVVLIVPADAKHAPHSFADLKSPTVRRVAIGEPQTVPAGQYAQQVLQSMHLSDSLSGRLVYGTNVRQVLSYVERGEVSAGIVYATDAKEAGDRVKIVATAKASAHEPVVYPAVLIRASKNQAAARRFLDFLSSGKARHILSEHGFTAAPESALAKSTQ